MARPVFVVGSPRSGTTWLANILCRHSQIACVRGTSPGLEEGINESAFFSHIDGAFGNLKDNYNNIIQLIEVFCSSNFFLASGLNKKIFYKNKPDSYHSFFRFLMEHVAQRDDKDIWLEKTPAHSFFLKKIISYYNDAKIVAIKRAPVSQIKSIYQMNLLKIKQLAKAGHSPHDVNLYKRRYLSINKMLFKYYACYKHIENVLRKKPEKVMMVAYEELVKSRKDIIISVCKFLGIEFEEGMLIDKDKQEIFSSFKTDDERNCMFTPVVDRNIQKAGYFFDKMPYLFYRFIYLIKHMIDLRRRTFPPQFYANILIQHNMDTSAIFMDKDF